MSIIFISQTCSSVTFHKMSSVSFGIIVQLEETDGGYYKLVIRTQTPFDFQYLRFCVWNKKSLNIDDKSVNVGECVKVSYEKAKFLKLKSMERVSFDNCEICGAFFERNDMDIQPPDVALGHWVSRLRQRKNKHCQQCNNLSENDRRICVNTELKLIGKTVKQYTYSFGTRLTFVDEDNEKYYFAIVYENDPIYLMINDLKSKQMYLVQGWVKSKSDDGYVMKVMGIEDC